MDTIKYQLNNNLFVVLEDLWKDLPNKPNQVKNAFKNQYLMQHITVLNRSAVATSTLISLENIKGIFLEI